jgi:two-component system sensor histidine kinase SenX3
MAALLGHVEVLRRGASRNPADLERSLSATHVAALRMSKLLREMLEIARLEQPELSLRRDRIEVAGLVAQAAEAAEDGSRDHRVRIEAVDPALEVLGDREALMRIVVNLLDNAARYSAAGTPICVRAGTSAGGEVEVAVTDHGPGIAAEEQERVFERLYRGEQARTSPGAGLGLAICRVLARRHGGDVTMQSEPGRGSTFVLRLPRWRGPTAGG